MKKQPKKRRESPHKGASGVRRIARAFMFSYAGLRKAWRFESAFRQEVTLAAVLIPLAVFMPVALAERALLVASMLLVLVVELLNSSVEAAIDRISLDDHRLSKRAKDFGSAAVLVAFILLAIIWGAIAGPAIVPWVHALF
jgi:diacylglycerol kinase (ATP)